MTQQLQISIVKQGANQYTQELGNVWLDLCNIMIGSQLSQNKFVEIYRLDRNNYRYIANAVIVSEVML